MDQLLSDQHLLAALLSYRTDIQADAFLAKYYNACVRYINTIAKYIAWLPQSSSCSTVASQASGVNRREYMNNIMCPPVLRRYCKQVHG